MRICSLVPGGTEILYALGLGADVVGVSHECDYPPAVRGKPVVVHSVIDQDGASSAAIDAAVRRSLETGEGLYRVDEDLLLRLRPDLIVTQSLCEVCAVNGGQVAAAVRRLPDRPEIVSLHPHTLEESLAEIRLLGERTGRLAEAERLVAAFRARLQALAGRLAGAGCPRVFCLEWLEPPMASGHWVPEMVERAFGVEVLGRTGQPSRYVTWEEVSAAQPDVLILMPCGFPIDRTRRELALLARQAWWRTLPAVRDGRVYAVNGPAYFNRSGPRLVDGIELLAGLLHPDRCADLIPDDAALAC